MVDITQVVCSIEDVRRYVAETFCARFDLDQRFFELSEFPILRRGRQAGTYFVYEGPRRLRLTAIWDFERELILFYGLNGQRFQTTRLLYSSQMARQAA